MANALERGDVGEYSEDVHYEPLLGGEKYEYQRSGTRKNEAQSHGTRSTAFTGFVLGILCTILSQYLYSNCGFGRTRGDNAHTVHRLANPEVGHTTRHQFPPPGPTNYFPTLFPTDVGYPGATPTGGEAALVATAPAYPIQSGTPNLIRPESLPNSDGDDDDEFDLFKSFGNLSPWYSVPSEQYGLPGASGQAPESCRVTGLHLLHRHGARYPTSWASYGGPSDMAARFSQVNKDSNWTASGPLEFLNNWTFKLGEEVLTPFGRQQLYDLGVSMRMKYGFLLHNFSESNTIPVFRTESQDRMLKSAKNFALGFFGWPDEDQYQQVVVIEANAFNNTLAPYKNCPNANNRTRADRGNYYVSQWADKYLADARKRLNGYISGFEFTIEEIYALQQMCAYETVAIGYSAFCGLFTQEEWRGFGYTTDIGFWYNSAFGSPVGRVQGIGYVIELLARLTHTPISEHRTSTNATLDDDARTFPLHQSLYVDATHEVTILNVITALGLSNFATDGPLPADHIPKHRKFRTERLAPFASNVQFQLLSCESYPSRPQIRVIINDGVVPLTVLEGCQEDKDGLCHLDAFVKAEQKIVDDTDWDWGCNGDWILPDGPAWETVTGDPPSKEYSRSGRV